MEGLDKIRSSVVQAEERVDLAQQGASTERANLADLLKEKQALIVAGEDSTGDELQDGLIATYGSLLGSADTTIIDNYNKVASELEGKEDQPVVVIHNWEESLGCTGFGDEPQYQTQSLTILGILNGSKLVFDYSEKSCSLPTEKYALSTRGSFSDEFEIVDGNVVVANVNQYFRGRMGFDLGTDLGVMFEVRGTFSRVLEKHVPSLIVAIGHQGVESLLSTEDTFTRYQFLEIRSLCEALGIEKIDPATESQRLYLDSMEEISGS
ncbi:MAG TPA: hypothetical protein VMR76_00115 [Candidatus Saccharimonadia bacterium]|nr:hypothetical protein [Candidatus Saccharimonadia bacterium]